MEGLGERGFEEWMIHSLSPDFMEEWIGRHFQLGGHKMAAIGRVLKKLNLSCVKFRERACKEYIFGAISFGRCSSDRSLPVFGIGQKFELYAPWRIRVASHKRMSKVKISTRRKCHELL